MNLRGHGIRPVHFQDATLTLRMMTNSNNEQPVERSAMRSRTAAARVRWVRDAVRSGHCHGNRAGLTNFPSKRLHALWIGHVRDMYITCTRCGCARSILPTTRGYGLAGGIR
jgi:hypothetical protein